MEQGVMTAIIILLEWNMFVFLNVFHVDEVQRSNNISLISREMVTSNEINFGD